MQDAGLTRRVAAVVLTTAVATAALANVPQFVWLQLTSEDVYRALHVKGGHGVPDLVADHFDSTRQDVGLFSELRRSAPGVVVTVADPTEELVADLDLVGLGLAAEVRRPAAPLPVVDATVVAAWGDAVVVAGEDEVLGPYGIVLGPAPVAAVTVVEGPDRRYVVDDRLLEGVTSS